jgi:hypothetical protein
MQQIPQRDAGRSLRRNDLRDFFATSYYREAFPTVPDPVEEVGEIPGSLGG